MITRQLKGFIVCLSVLFAACQSPSQPSRSFPSDSIALTGVISQGGHEYYFSPCDSHQQWLLELPTSHWQSHFRSPQAQPGAFYVQGYLKASSVVSQSDITLVATQLTPIHSTASPSMPCHASTRFRAKDEPLVGHYQTQVKPGEHTYITLALRADHSAQEQYFHVDSERPSTEQTDTRPSFILHNRGFWQRLSANKVEVVMTLIQDQRAVLRRVYHTHNGVLTTQTESINHQEFAIHPALIFYPTREPQ